MAVVTGAGSGIGRAIALALGAAGAPVAALDLDGASAEETASLIAKAGGRAKAFQGDTSKAAEVLLCLSCESREEVDGLVAKAVAAGGSTYDKPEDFGFMYTHSFVDPDGHGWGLFHVSATPAQK